MKKCKRYPHLWATPATPAPKAPAECDTALIEDYLDKIMAPLVEVLPYERRVALRNETRTQIFSLAAAFQELGSSKEDGIAEAIRRVNSVRSSDVAVAPKRRPRPAPAGMVFSRGGWFLPSPRGAMLTALGWFTIGTFCLFLSESSNPDIQLFPDFLVPLWVGFATGLRSRERPVLGTFLAWAVVFTATYVLESTLPGTARTGWPSAAAQIQSLFWLPISLASAWAAAKFRPQIFEALGRWDSDRETPMLPEPSSLTNSISRP